MTRDDAFKAISEHRKSLDDALDRARSQFAIRLCYVTAHEELMDLARKIAKGIPK